MADGGIRLVESRVAWHRAQCVWLRRKRSPAATADRGFRSADGQPFSNGVINISSVHPDAFGTMTEIASLIRDGRFSLAHLIGLMPGTYRISINSGQPRNKPETSTASPGKAESVAEELIPRKYNAMTQLEFEVTDSLIKELTVDLKSD